LSARLTNPDNLANNSIDRSTLPSVTVTPPALDTQTTISGSETAITDNDWTTTYIVRSENVVFGAHPTLTSQVTLDYGRIFTSCQVSFRAKFEIVIGNPSASYVETSIDGTNWTQITADLSGTTTESAIAVSRLRYVRLTAYSTVTPFQAFTKLTIYQCRMTGVG